LGTICSCRDKEEEDKEKGKKARSISEPHESLFLSLLSFTFSFFLASNKGNQIQPFYLSLIAALASAAELFKVVLNSLCSSWDLPSSAMM
jgi:hypothetical protein